ncbi:MAG: hypothetical protein R3A10_04180 [Caldilineaceae bacterium]
MQHIALEPGERGRVAFVDVLPREEGTVDAKRRRAAQATPRGEVVRLLVHVQHIRATLAQFLVQGRIKVGVKVAVAAHGNGRQFVAVSVQALNFLRPARITPGRRRQHRQRHAAPGDLLRFALIRAHHQRLAHHDHMHRVIIEARRAGRQNR